MESIESVPTTTLCTASGKILRTTPIYDLFWYFAAERQAIFMNRLAGSTMPWTNDPILQNFRFTNPYRASDRVSQYLIRHVLYEGSQDPVEIFFRTTLFRLFNKIETWEHLINTLGEIAYSEFDVPRFARLFNRMANLIGHIYSSAYILPSPNLGSHKKYVNHLRLIEMMIRDGAAFKIRSAESLNEVFLIIKGYPSLGDFLSFQLAIDLNYSTMLDFSEDDFVMAGPGAKSGIDKCFLDLNGCDYAEVIKSVALSADKEFKKRNFDFKTLWGRKLQLIDFQNLFCEIDKYSRLSHPNICGSSTRKRIKHKYHVNGLPLPQWYPPKWNIRVPRSYSVTH